MARSASRSSRKKKRQVIRWTDGRKAAFLALVAEGCTVTYAAEQQGLSRRSAYELRDRDAAFKAAWLEAYEESTELLEREAFERAKGRDEAVMDKKGNIHYVKKYSDILLIFMLKARKPKVYNDRLDVTVTDRRVIEVNLLPVEQGPGGKLRLVEGTADVPLLGTGEGNDG